jgi:hypothetical protein
MRKTALTAALLGLAILSGPTFAADTVTNPLEPSYRTPAQKEWFAKHMHEFMEMDKNSDGMLSMEEYLNDGNPLTPGFDQDAKYRAKYAEWLKMDREKRGIISMHEYMAYMDSDNPLSPTYKRK